jgi:hypothetical protein
MDTKPEAAAAADLDARLEARRRLGRIPGESVPVENETAPTGEVPEPVMAELVADASARSGVAVTDIAVLRAESLIFPDGSLGCPKPDVAYTPAPVPGYRVVLEAQGRQYDYRVPEGGRFVLCEGMAPPGGTRPPPPKKGSDTISRRNGV